MASNLAPVLLPSPASPEQVLTMGQEIAELKRQLQTEKNTVSRLILFAHRYRTDADTRSPIEGRRHREFAAALLAEIEKGDTDI